MVERAIQDVQGQMRTMKLAVEWRYKTTLKENHNVLPWMVRYAAMTINLCRRGEDGRTPYERRKNRKFHRVLPEFAECVWYLKPESAGVDKLASRWEDGVFLGIREESERHRCSQGECIQEEARIRQMEY